MNNQPYLLSLKDVSKAYPQSIDGEPLQVLDRVNLNVHEGSSLSIIGPSGSGKSTLLNIIGTLDKPSSGSVRLDGQNLAELNDAQLAQIRNRKIGFVFQAHHLLPQCTVLENVLIPTIVPTSALSPDEAKDRAMLLLQRIGLHDRIHYRPGQLSGGERQRVAFIRALINQPRLILADEPTGSLDQANAERLMHLLIDLNKEEGVTLIVVTHAIDLAFQLDHVLQIQNGNLVKAEKVS